MAHYGHFIHLLFESLPHRRELSLTVHRGPVLCAHSQRPGHMPVPPIPLLSLPQYGPIQWAKSLSVAWIMNVWSPFHQKTHRVLSSTRLCLLIVFQSHFWTVFGLQKTLSHPPTFFWPLFPTQCPQELPRGPPGWVKEGTTVQPRAGQCRICACYLVVTTLLTPHHLCSCPTVTWPGFKAVSDSVQSHLVCLHFLLKFKLSQE